MIPSLRAVASEIAAKGCQIIHGDYPPGTTCLGKIEHARENPTRYTPDYRERILRGEGVCDRCRLRRALSPAGDQPPALFAALYPCGAFDVRRTRESAVKTGEHRSSERTCCEQVHNTFRDPALRSGGRRVRNIW